MANTYSGSASSPVACQLVPVAGRPSSSAFLPSPPSRIQSRKPSSLDLFPPTLVHTPRQTTNTNTNMVNTRSKSIRRRSVRGVEHPPSSPPPEKKKGIIADLRSILWHDMTKFEKLVVAIILAAFCFIAVTILAAFILRFLKPPATQQPPMLAKSIASETTTAEPEGTDTGACLNFDDALDGDLALCPKPNGGYW